MRGNPTFLGVVVAGLFTGIVTAADSIHDDWLKTLQRAAFVKEGMEEFRHPQYEYESLGLGGTVMRVDPYGLTKSQAEGVNTNGWLKHLPYLSYQFWWDTQAHRQLPFDLTGGYGPNLAPGEITSFRHHLDIASGFLTMDLGLRFEMAASEFHKTGGAAFQSHREMFVTPEGVLVIRIQDSPGTPSPFELRVDTNPNVRIYLNQGIYAKNHDGWTGTHLPKPHGMVVVGTRPKSCTATLAVALDGPDATVDPQSACMGAAKPAKTMTFYIAPGSSLDFSDPVAGAWSKADAARARGYAAAHRDTARWWKAFYARSAVNLPDRHLATWYARSTYYLGVFFGQTEIPPGCNGTSVESFAGAVCPEYDLVLDQMALLYGNHFDEARRVVDWLGRTLPRAERYATEGLTLHHVSMKYSRGAKFGPLLGYDGTILEPPTMDEGVWAYEDFAGNNIALMALNYVDWSADNRSTALAHRILKETTQVSVQDLEWRPDFDAYLNRPMASTVQQAATRFGLKESVRRRVAEPGWEAMAEKVLLPTSDYRGSRVLTAGLGATSSANSGDATWLSPAWWYQVVKSDDPLVRESYWLFRNSKTGNYVFNNGWMGVIAAKLQDGNEAVCWARKFVQPGVTLFDDNCFGELVSDFEDFKKTPEVAAHAALLCNLNQMLIDPDNENLITVFPAIPTEWERLGVAFRHLAAKGGILVSGEFSPRHVRVTLENCSPQNCRRTLRVRLPAGLSELRHPAKGLREESGWALVSDVQLRPKKEVGYTFEPQK